MTVFVDTSALYAILDRDDSNHRKAAAAWDKLLAGDAALVTTNYVLVECCALLQNRIGIEAVRTLHEDILPVMTVEWVKGSMHSSAMSALLAAGKRRLSLVDCVSFEVMRSLGIRSVFAFDPHFAEQGFDCRP